MDKLKKVKEALEFYADKANYYIRPMNRPEPIVIEMGAKAHEALTTLNEVIERLECIEWREILTAPRDTTILISLMNHYNKQRTIKAIYFSKWTHEPSDDWYEYCEDKDEYFAPEGWYEDIYSETGMDCGYIFISEEPTHWMPLPSQPINTIKGEK